MSSSDGGGGAPEGALLALCEGAARREAIETPDSWMMRGEGAELRQRATEALRGDRLIGRHTERNCFLQVAGLSGTGLEILDPWLRGLLHRVLIDPGLDRSQWEQEIGRFLDLLRVEGGTVPCTIRATVAGFELEDGAFEIGGGAVVHPAVGSDFIVPIGEKAPHGVVFEYRTRRPAVAGPIGHEFSEEVVEGVEAEHRARLTRFLLSVALATEAPAQEHLVLGAIDFQGGGSGRNAEEVGAIVLGHRYLLDQERVERVSRCYGLLAEKGLRGVGVATRRFLLARTERVRPADRIIDYAIALESMSSESGGEEQGAELAQRIAGNTAERRAVEAEHERFRAARREIVHEGGVPADAVEVAAVGEGLVRRSLRAMTCS